MKKYFQGVFFVAMAVAMFFTADKTHDNILYWGGGLMFVIGLLVWFSPEDLHR